MLRVLRLNGFKAFRLERKQRRDPRDPLTIGPFVPHHGGAAEQLLGDLRSASVPGWAPLFDANVISERVSTGATVRPAGCRGLASPVCWLQANEAAMHIGRCIYQPIANLVRLAYSTALCVAGFCLS